MQPPAVVLNHRLCTGDLVQLMETRLSDHLRNRGFIVVSCLNRGNMKTWLQLCIRKQELLYQKFKNVRPAVLVLCVTNMNQLQDLLSAFSEIQMIIRSKAGLQMAFILSSLWAPLVVHYFGARVVNLEL